MNTNVIVILESTTMTAEAMGVVRQTLVDTLMVGILGEDSGESDTLKIGSRCRFAG